MTLAAGHRFGGYEIAELVGSGGMGEVYRARDVDLGRDVAIKVLPPQFSLDPQRLARFTREAQILASLNHPNIATLYGSVEAAGVQGLVLELIEGDTLADRIAAGALPFAAALDIARQIAAALEAAHEHGIVHRDLKPANIKLRPDGTAKLLDFGVAKIVATEARGSDTRAATVTVLDAPNAGGLGTPAYMSPEQVRGLGVDQRADIWAFGCVLYEMLTGTRPFAGDTVNDTIGAILHREPDLRSLPAACPASIRRLLERCLAKDRQERLQHIGDARIELRDAAAHDAPRPPWSRSARTWLAAAAIAGLLAALVLLTDARREPASSAARVTRFEILPPEEHELALRRYARVIAIARDGSRIVYSTGNGRLTVRSLDSLESTLLAELGAEASNPIFSPNGLTLAFRSGSALKTVAIAGGPAALVADVGEYTDSSAAWSDDGSIFVASTRGLLRVTPGGEPQLLAAPDAARGEQSFGTPEPLPGGRTVLFMIRPTRIEAPVRLVALDLMSGERKDLVRGGTEPRFLPTGHLVYAADGALQAVRFDAQRLEILSTPAVVAPDVLVNSNGTANYSIGDDGTLAYVPAEFGRPLRRLTWVDRDGKETALPTPQLSYSYPRLSPDGARVALDVRQPDSDVWLWHLEREQLTRITFDPGENVLPSWSPDGEYLAFADGRSGTANIYRQPISGGALERLTQSSRRQVPVTFTPDGGWLLFQEAQPAGGWDLFMVSLDEAHRIEPLLRSEHSEMNTTISPDGRWLAYASDESGRVEIYVRPFPNVDEARLQVSRDGGSKPLWSRDGREVFFVSPQRELMAAAFSPEPRPAVTRVERLFDATAYTDPESGTGARPFDLSLDGARFLMVRREPAGGPLRAPRIVVVLGWDDELRRLLP